MGGLAGALLAAITSNPLALLVGGLIAAILACKDPGDGAVLGLKAGLLSGLILLVAYAGGIMIVSFLGATIGAAVGPGLALIFTALGMLVAFMIIAVSIIFSAIGGFIGGYLRDFNEQCPAGKANDAGEKQ